MTKLIRISNKLTVNLGYVSSIEYIQGERLREIGYNPEVKGVIRFNIPMAGHSDIRCYSIEAFNNKINSLTEILEIKQIN